METRATWEVIQQIFLRLKQVLENEKKQDPDSSPKN